MELKVLSGSGDNVQASQGTVWLRREGRGRVGRTEGLDDGRPPFFDRAYSCSQAKALSCEVALLFGLHWMIW